MKLSIGLFAAVSAVDPEFELPKICGDYAAISPYFVNCWSPSGHFASQAEGLNGTEHSDWFFQTNEGGECGFQYIDTDLSLVNKTCEFTPAFDNNYVVGNAVFVPKGASATPGVQEIVGFDITGDFNYVQKWDVLFNWEQDFNLKLGKYIAEVEEANKNNGTEPEPFSYDRTYGCAAEIGAFNPPTFSNCIDSGAPYADYAIMITNQHAGDKNNNYAIANYGGEGDVFTVTIKDKTCSTWGFTAHDANQATLTVDQIDSDCVITIEVGNAAAQLLYFQGSVDEGVIDFFNDVTIA